FASGPVEILIRKPVLDLILNMNSVSESPLIETPTPVLEVAFVGKSVVVVRRAWLLPFLGFVECFVQTDLARLEFLRISIRCEEGMQNHIMNRKRFFHGGRRIFVHQSNGIDFINRSG